MADTVTNKSVLVKDLPTTLPGGAFSYLISVLTGAEKIDRLQAVKAAYDIVGFLLSKFFNEATIESKAVAKKLSKKQIAEALKQLQDPSGASAKAFPAWLIPILLDLATKWLSGAK